jgi:hypothetical protein
VGYVDRRILDHRALGPPHANRHGAGVAFTNLDIDADKPIVDEPRCSLWSDGRLSRGAGMIVDRQFRRNRVVEARAVWGEVDLGTSVAQP